jgi:hypothetical protein
MSLITKEPVAVALVGLDGLVAAGLALAQTFGLLDWTPAQVGAAVGLVTAVVAVVAPLLRSRVVPLVKHDALLTEALHTPAPMPDIDTDSDDVPVASGAGMGDGVN